MITSGFFYLSPFFTDAFIKDSVKQVLDYLKVESITNRKGSVILKNNLSNLDKLDNSYFKRREIGEFEVFKDYFPSYYRFDNGHKGEIFINMYPQLPYSKMPQSFMVEAEAVMQKNICLWLSSPKEFTFGMEYDSNFALEQNCESISFYKRKFGSIKNCKIVKNVRNEFVIDTRNNLGKSYSLNYCSFMLAWRMWFGEYFLKLISEKKIINAVETIKNGAFWEKHNDTLMVQLYAEPEDIHKKEVKEHIKQFYELLDLKSFLEHNKLRIDSKFENSNFKMDGKIYQTYKGNFSQQEILEMEKDYELFELSFWEKLKIKFE